MDRRKIQAAGQHFEQLFAVVGDAAARAAQSEARPHDYREADLSGKFKTVSQIVDERGLWNVEADLLHRVFEKQPVFRLLNGLELRADQLDIVFFEHPASASSTARLSAVCPPTVGSSANPLLGAQKLALHAIISSRYSRVSGSM